METQICETCKEEFPIDNFSWKSKPRGVRHKRCKLCVSKHRKEWYKEHGDEERARIYAGKIARHQTMRKWFGEYKRSLKCATCSESDESCLDFHHKNPADKDASVSSVLYSRNWSQEHIEREIAKCQVLCSNCHRKLHAKERRDGATDSTPLSEGGSGSSILPPGTKREI